MSENKLTETLEKAIGDLIDGCLKPGKGFVLTQAPDVIKELILFKKFSLVFEIFLAAVLSVVIFSAASFVVPRTDGFWYAFNFLQILPFFWAACSVETLFQLFFAPKVYLIEYSANLMKENK